MTAEHTKINSQIKSKNIAIAKAQNAIIDLENKLTKAKLKLAQIESELKELERKRGFEIKGAPKATPKPQKP